MHAHQDKLYFYFTTMLFELLSCTNIIKWLQLAYIVSVNVVTYLKVILHDKLNQDRPHAPAH